MIIFSFCGFVFIHSSCRESIDATTEFYHSLSICAFNLLKSLSHFTSLAFSRFSLSFASTKLFRLFTVDNFISSFNSDWLCMQFRAACLAPPSSVSASPDMRKRATDPHRMTYQILFSRVLFRLCYDARFFFSVSAVEKLGWFAWRRGMFLLVIVGCRLCCRLVCTVRRLSLASPHTVACNETRDKRKGNEN